MEWYATNTGVAVDLVSDTQLLEQVEQSKRGGYTFVGTERYVKANNKSLDDYDEDIESTCLLYIDADNLYGQAMCQHLPYSNIKLIMIYYLTVLNIHQTNHI